MWRWIQNQSRGRCEVLSAPASDRHSLLAYVGDVRPRLFGDGDVAAHEARFVSTTCWGSLLLAVSGRATHADECPLLGVKRT